jgi:nucleoside-diphosphate-sugar epimerase
MMRELHVVVGRGMVGTRLARTLAEAGREVRWVSRRPQDAAAAGVTQVAGDAASLESLLAVAPTAKVVYNCVNPPNYHRWEHEWPPLARTISAYAVRAGADLVTASNLYGYGPHEGVLTEDVPLRATWRNGRVRAAMWREVPALQDAGKLRATEVRGSDDLCASDQSRMGDRVAPHLLRGKPVQLLGALDQPHTWTDPDDVARLMMTLAQDERGWGKPWHVPSPEPRTRRQVVADIADALGIRNQRLSALGPVMEALIGLFNPVVRELNRGGYQFSRPFIMNSQAAQVTFGHTPKPWPQMIDDLIQPYLAQSQRKGERP